MFKLFKVLPCGDRAFLLQFGGSISFTTSQHVQRMFHALKTRKRPGIIEFVPNYCSLLVFYDPLTADLESFLGEVRETEKEVGQWATGKVKKVNIPVIYGGEFGPDLDFVANHHALPPEEVIRLHTKPVYTNCMYGFDPGYILLLGLPRRLETPRMDNPRLSIPEGTVGIGGAQTGIYPFDRSGGWRLIGRTPLRMFDLHRNPPVFVNIGDRVTFYRIDRDRYDQILERVKHGDEPISTYIES
jgi:KipI family sensor histidine kinase inhibitor